MKRRDAEHYIGQVVRVGRGRTLWRITDWLYFDYHRPNRITHAELERVDRADVHTSATLDRLISVEHDNLSQMA